MTFNPQITPVRARENASPNPSVAAPRIWALIPCAGSGSRAQTSLPKQYQNVAGQPMVLHTLAAFAGVAGIASTLLVVAPDDRFIDTLMTASTGGPVLKDATLIVANCGGQTRATSVFNGLNHLVRLGAGPQDWVLVHDAARCLIAPAQIQALIDACLPDDVGGLLA
jgi:2-C-methyl-D-erythritol 4-phosphate cytidylyltransferase